MVNILFRFGFCKARRSGLKAGISWVFEAIGIAVAGRPSVFPQGGGAYARLPTILLPPV